MSSVLRDTSREPDVLRDMRRCRDRRRPAASVNDNGHPRVAASWSPEQLAREANGLRGALIDSGEVIHHPQHCLSLDSRLGVLHTRPSRTASLPGSVMPALYRSVGAVHNGSTTGSSRS
jgi:hypothetical protein